MQRDDSQGSTVGKEGGERGVDEMSTRGSGGREWTPGGPIRFEVAEEREKVVTSGSAQQDKRDSRFVSFPHPSFSNPV